MTLNDPNWLPGIASGSAVHTALVDLAAGESYTVNITFDVSMFAPGMSLLNTAHITLLYDEDNDPMVDANPTNDWDDAIVEVANTIMFDMSLTKNISSNSPFPHFFGSEVEFEVTVCNDGNAPINNYVISDELSNGFEFLTGHPQNAIWSPQGGGLFEATIASIPMNSCVTLPMFTRILTNNGPWDNHAEIVSATTPNGTPILEALDNSSFVNNLDVVAIVPMNPVGVIGSCVFKDVN